MSIESIVAKYEGELEDAKTRYQEILDAKKCEHICPDCQLRIASNEAQESLLSVFINEKTLLIQELKDI
jgi:hypothetical protein